MPNSFETKIEQYAFDKDGIKAIKENCLHGEDWPVVYILSGKKEAYVGETQNAFSRMNQHLANNRRNKICSTRSKNDNGSNTNRKWISKRNNNKI